MVLYRRLPLVVLLISTVFAIQAQTKLTLSVGKPFKVPLMGYNSDMSNTPYWSQSDFSIALQSLYPKTLRYPGGSNSLYWNWQKGWTWSFSELVPFLQEKHFEYEGKAITTAQHLKVLAKEKKSSNSFWRQLHRYNAKLPKYNTIAEFSKALNATQSNGVFTLNVITSHLKNELEMLKAVQNQGIEPKYVELGNEVYAENLLTKHIYPSVDNYIDTCLKWSEKLWKEFPNLHIGVVGGDKNKRTRGWNEKLALALQKSFPTKQNQLHFILHYYSVFKHPQYDFNTPAGYQQLVAFPKMDLQQKLKQWQWDKTTNYSTWVTEYNIIEHQPYIINNSWAHALLVASQINQLIQQTSSEMFHFHSLGAESFPVFAALHMMNKNENYLLPTNSGLITLLWNKLTKNADQLYEIELNTKSWIVNYPQKSNKLPNNPNSSQNINFEPVYAYMTSKKNKRKLIIVNFTDQKIEANLSKVLKSCQMEQYFAKLNAIQMEQEKSMNVNGLVELKPYSISLFEE